MNEMRSESVQTKVRFYIVRTERTNPFRIEGPWIVNYAHTMSVSFASKNEIGIQTKHEMHTCVSSVLPLPLSAPKLNHKCY